eukprot:524549-Pelagomonas_calceolata.AAC.3
MWAPPEHFIRAKRACCSHGRQAYLTPCIGFRQRAVSIGIRCDSNASCAAGAERGSSQKLTVVETGTSG